MECFYQARHSCAAKKPITSELRHIVNVLWSVGMMSIFDIARMPDLGSKTGNRTLASLKMF